MRRARTVGFAIPIATLAALLIFLNPDFARAQTPSSPAGGATAQPAPSSATTSSSAHTPTVAASTGTATSHGVHVVTVTFNYDFSKTPACSSKITKHCVEQFIAYDISGGASHPVLLFPIPLPPNPAGAVKGIRKAGPPLDFESGKHLISVSAMSPDGAHSRRSLCTTWITIP